MQDPFPSPTESFLVHPPNAVFLRAGFRHAVWTKFRSGKECDAPPTTPPRLPRLAPFYYKLLNLLLSHARPSDSAEFPPSVARTRGFRGRQLIGFSPLLKFRERFEMVVQAFHSSSSVKRFSLFSCWYPPTPPAIHGSSCSFFITLILRFSISP